VEIPENIRIILSCEVRICFNAINYGIAPIELVQVSIRSEFIVKMISTGGSLFEIVATLC